MGVTLNGYLRCANDAEAARVRAALEEHIRLTRAEPGCISFEVTATEDPLVWRVAEEFTDPAAFKAHQARAAASAWAQETKGIARDYTVEGLE
ncbi:putative quinol monooxygenase [Marimonas sp. MJW-29]|uniref:Quinol monooxygenase n=1 Tax=Sulfitobacter sediminis TaxID=3234186 RepID=A0ABV3RQD8_9RHOB